MSLPVTDRSSLDTVSNTVSDQSCPTVLPAEAILQSFLRKQESIPLCCEETASHYEQSVTGSEVVSPQETASVETLSLLRSDKRQSIAQSLLPIA